MATLLVNPLVTVNGQAVRIVPNSFKYNDGFGETTTLVHTAGPGDRETLYADDITTQFSMCGFQIYATEENANLLRTWKQNKDNRITATQGGFSRTFNKSFIKSDIEVPTGTDPVIDIEFNGDPAV